MTGTCKRLGFAILPLTCLLPWRSQQQADELSLWCDMPLSQHTMQEFGIGFAFCDFRYIYIHTYIYCAPFSSLLHPLSFWPVPQHVRSLLTFYPTNKMTYYRNCVPVSLKKKKKKKSTLGVSVRRRICLMFGQQNGNPHLLYFSRRQL